MGYKRYGSSGSKPQFNNEHGEGITELLKKPGTEKYIYFGIKKPANESDANKPWRELTSSDFAITLTSDTDGCNAKVGKNTNDSTNKTGIITYTLSNNSSGKLRLITFKYKTTELFKILLEPETTDIYVYFRFFKEYNEYMDGYGSSSYIVSKNNTVYTDPIYYEDAYINNLDSSKKNILYHSTNNKDISLLFYRSINILISNNLLTYISGKQFNDTNGYHIILAPTKMYISNTSTEEVKDDSVMYVLYGFTDPTKGGQTDYNVISGINSTINWSNISNEDESSIGKYKVNKVLSPIVLIKSTSGNFLKYADTIQTINLKTYNTDINIKLLKTNGFSGSLLYLGAVDQTGLFEGYMYTNTIKLVNKDNPNKYFISLNSNEGSVTAYPMNITMPYSITEELITFKYNNIEVIKVKRIPSPSIIMVKPDVSNANSTYSSKTLNTLTLFFIKNYPSFNSTNTITVKQASEYIMHNINCNNTIKNVIFYGTYNNSIFAENSNFSDALQSYDFTVMGEDSEDLLPTYKTYGLVNFTQALGYYSTDGNLVFSPDTYFGGDSISVFACNRITSIPSTSITAYQIALFYMKNNVSGYNHKMCKYMHVYK